MSSHGRALSRLGFPAIVAHRGASSTRPENTLASFEEAIALGAQIVELDVRLSRDGRSGRDARPGRRSHDGRNRLRPRAHRGRAGRPSRRAGRDRADVRRGPRGGERPRGARRRDQEHPGEPAYDPAGEPIVAAVHAELERGVFDGVALVISFNPSSIEASKALAPDVPTGFLTTDLVDPREALAYAAAKGHDMVLPGRGRRSRPGSRSPRRSTPPACARGRGRWTIPRR